MSDLFWLTDAQMARLAPFFPKSHGKPRVDDRRVLSWIFSSIAMACGGAMRLGSMARTRRSTIVGNGGGEWLNATGPREAKNRASSPR
jgi:transposase